MDSGSDLKRDISTGLRDEVSKHLAAGESIVISLPGSFGEALVVTDRRAIVAREQAHGLDVSSSVYAHLLSHVKGAVITPLANGGYLEMDLKPPVANIESARVYFPTSEDARFRAAAEYLASLPAATPQTVFNTGAAAATEAGLCTSCGARIDRDASFCSACGSAVKIICRSCGQGSAPDAVYCSGCGRQMVEFVPSCQKCGARTTRWMSYCPDCGAMQSPICVGCGIQIMPDWTYCASCGRQLGADIDCRTSAALRRRSEQREPSPAAAATPVQEPGASASGNSAEEHNRRGTELFETEDFEGAIREYSAAVQLDPSNPAYHCNLGMAYDEADLDEQALAEYQKALELDPNDLTALLSLGYMYSETDRPDEARAVWNQVLQIAPDSAEAQEARQNLRHQGQL